MKSDLHTKLKKNYGLRLSDKFLGDVANALQVSKDTLVTHDVETATKAWHLFLTKRDAIRHGQESGYHARYIDTNLIFLKNQVNALYGCSSDQDLLLFRSLTEYCGAIQLNDKEVFTHAFDLISLDQEDLQASTPDLNFGISLELYTEWNSLKSYPVYELVVWGDTWVKCVTQC